VKRVGSAKEWADRQAQEENVSHLSSALPPFCPSLSPLVPHPHHHHHHLISLSPSSTLPSVACVCVCVWHGHKAEKRWWSDGDRMANEKKLKKSDSETKKSQFSLFSVSRLSTRVIVVVGISCTASSMSKQTQKTHCCCFVLLCVLPGSSEPNFQ